MSRAPSPLRLRIDGAALAANWRWLSERSGGAACGAAVKADGYGLGAIEATRRLAEAGCRDFFVATWNEAEALLEAVPGVSLSVLHGVGEADMAAALESPARPVLSSAEQARRWREQGGGRPCDAMVDTGTWPLPPIFALLREGGDLAPEELARTFNCGVGMVVIVNAQAAEAMPGEMFRIGRIEAGPRGCTVSGGEGTWGANRDWAATHHA